MSYLMCMTGSLTQIQSKTLGSIMSDCTLTLVSDIPKTDAALLK